MATQELGTFATAEATALKAGVSHVPERFLSLYNGQWDPALATRIVELGERGQGLLSIAAKIGIPSGVLRQWEVQKRYPDLCDALARARDLAAAYWLEQATQGCWEEVQTKNGSYTRANDRLITWVAERQAPDLRQSLEIDIRALIGEVKQEDLPLDQLRRLAAGESPLAVLRPGASIPASEEPPESV